MVVSNIQTSSKKKNPALIKVLFFLVGSIALVLAMVGVFLPLLPTTPFVLLAVWCYLRSSEKIYRKVCNTRLYKNTAGAMMERKGLPLKTKLMILIPVYAMLITVFFLVDSIWIRMIILALIVIKTIVFCRMRTLVEGKTEKMISSKEPSEGTL